MPEAGQAASEVQVPAVEDASGASRGCDAAGGGGDWRSWKMSKAGAFCGNRLHSVDPAFGMHIGHGMVGASGTMVEIETEVPRNASLGASAVA